MLVPESLLSLKFNTHLDEPGVSDHLHASAIEYSEVV